MKVTNIWYGTFVYTSWIALLRSLRCVRLLLCIFSAVKSPHSDALITISDPLSAGVVMRFASRLVACSFCSSKGTSCNNIVVTLASVPLYSKASGEEGSDAFWCSIRNIPRMHLSINVLGSKTFTAMWQWMSYFKAEKQVKRKLWTIPNETRPCKSPISTTTGIRRWVKFICSVVALSFEDSRCSRRHFHWYVKTSSLIKSDLSSVFTKHAVECSTNIVSLIPTRPFYVRFFRNSTSGACTWNCLSLLAVVDLSYLAFAITIFAVISTPWAFVSLCSWDSACGLLHWCRTFWLFLLYPQYSLWFSFSSSDLRRSVLWAVVLGYEIISSFSLHL